MTKNKKSKINTDQNCNFCETRRVCVVKLRRINLDTLKKSSQIEDDQSKSFNKNKEKTIKPTKASAVLLNNFKLKNFQVRVQRMTTKNLRNQSKPLLASDLAVNVCNRNTVLAAKNNKNIMETAKEAVCEITTRSGRQIKQSKYDRMGYVITTKQRNDLQKLSLSRASFSTLTPANDHQLLHLETNQNSSFSDVGNATRARNQNKPADQPTKKTHTNLANKANIIEQILFSDEEIEVEMPKTIEKEPKRSELECTSKVENNPKKFFHRKISTDIEFKKPTLRQTKKFSNKKQTTAHRKSSVGKIYEFLSSQSDSDSANKGDPAADIIKKLIDEGRVRVAKRGKGKQALKRKPRATVKRNPKPVNKNKKEQKAQREAIITEKNIPTFADENNEDNFNDHDEEFLGPVDTYEEGIVETERSAVARVGRQNNKQSINGTFSRLARSVLLNQTEKNDSTQKKMTDQQKLLEVARKFVSTPVNRKVPPPTHLSNLSPISMITQTAITEQFGNVSPWRVDEDAHLPSVFHFSKNSSHLPSFSSDYIPSTPQKNNKYKYHMLDTPLEPVDNTTSEIQHKSSPSKSSFSSNDSNAENLPPPRLAAKALHSDVDGNIDINADVFNLRQQPNPRRTYSRRSPLKAINILEVVTLPPWKDSENLNIKTVQKTNNNKSNTEKNVKSSKMDLFGFEDFIDDNDTEDQILAEQTNATMHHNTNNLTNQSLHDKLHNLNKWRPDIANQINKQPQSKPISRVFDNDTGRLKQRSIKKMLCSTMINPGPSSKSNVVQNLESDGSDSDEQKKTNETRNTDLFKDPDPQLSFDDRNPHRTYVRPHKKRRKLRHNFVMFMDSDDSGDENESDGEDEFRVKKKTEYKTKRKNKIEKPQPDLNSFVDNFNSMCKEVEQYELVVE